MKIIITETQYDSVLNQLNKTISSVTDPYKMLGITRPSQQSNKPKGMGNREPQNVSGKQLMDGSVMNVSERYKSIVREWEGDPKNRVGGVKQPKLKAYRDNSPGKIPTIGYGHTAGVTMGMKITKQQAEDFLMKDSEDAINCVKRIMDNWKKKGLKTYKLTQGQFDAMVSMTFNAGCGSMRQSQFIQELKRGNTKKAAELIKTFMIGTNVGVKNRRQQEYKLFIS